jgi:ABC-type antimicrobial peptide transport system permease subunit
MGRVSAAAVPADLEGDMRGLIADCRHAVRLYKRTPGGSLIAVLVLAIGVAFVGAFLSLYVDLVLRPHPGFEQSSGLSTIGQSSGPYLISFPYEFVGKLADEMTSVDAVAAWTGATTLIGPNDEEAIAGLVSEEFFDGLRPRLALGRGFRVEDHAPDAEPVVVLSYRYWQARFGGDSDVLGKSIEIARDPTRPYQGPSLFSTAEPEQSSAQFRVIGIMSRSLRGFPTSGGELFEPAVWVPLIPAWALFRGVPESMSLATNRVSSYVRRAPGVTSAAVASELRARYDEPGTVPGRFPGYQLDAIDGIVSSIGVQRDAKRQLEMFLAGSVLLALVAAANVSLFLLARAPGRSRELGVRMAVGAPMRRLVRQLSTEAGLLVVVSAALGLLMSLWLSLYLRSLAFMRDSEWTHVTLLDWRVLGISSAFLLMLTLLVSLTPIAGLKRLGIGAASRHGTTRASLAQRLAGTTQIAAAATLGAAAIAFIWYLGALILGHPGYELDNRYLISFGRMSSGESDIEDPLQRSIVETARRHDAIESIAGVTAVGFGEPVPGDDTSRVVRLPDPTDSSRTIDVHEGLLEPAFIEVLGIKLLYGRVADAYEPGVVLVNQTLARLLWGHDDVVGERVPGSSNWSRDGAEIVGVLQDLSFGHPAADPVPFVFTPAPLASRYAVVETQLTAAGFQQAFERIVSEGVMDTVFTTQPLAALRSELIAPDRARGLLTIATAVLVVLLAAFGYYGTQRFLVMAGRREYAIRASLGAGPTALGRLVVMRSLSMSTPGLAIGALLAFLTVAWLRSGYLSREISPALVTVAVCVGLTLLVLGATVGPAREAKRTRPAVFLRED